MNDTTEVISLLRRIAVAVERLAPPPCENAEPDPRLDQLADLECQLAGMEPGERARAIQERMGISRTSYYRLRASTIEAYSRGESHQSHVARGTGD